MKKSILLCAAVMLAGCGGQAVDDSRVMVEGNHAHYHVHGPEIEHGHRHEDFATGGHTHAHDNHEPPPAQPPSLHPR